MESKSYALNHQSVTNLSQIPLTKSYNDDKGLHCRSRALDSLRPHPECVFLCRHFELITTVFRMGCLHKNYRKWPKENPVASEKCKLPVQKFLPDHCPRTLSPDWSHLHLVRCGTGNRLLSELFAPAQQAPHQVCCDPLLLRYSPEADKHILRFAPFWISPFFLGVLYLTESTNRVLKGGVYGGVAKSSLQMRDFCPKDALQQLQLIPIPRARNEQRLSDAPMPLWSNEPQMGCSLGNLKPWELLRGCVGSKGPSVQTKFVHSKTYINLMMLFLSILVKNKDLFKANVLFWTKPALFVSSCWSLLIACIVDGTQTWFLGLSLCVRFDDLICCDLVFFFFTINFTCLFSVFNNVQFPTSFVLDCFFFLPSNIILTIIWMSADQIYLTLKVNDWKLNFFLFKAQPHLFRRCEKNGTTLWLECWNNVQEVGHLSKGYSDIQTNHSHNLSWKEASPIQTIP